MYFSIDFDSTVLSVIVLALMSALLVGWWISKHYGRIVAAEKSGNMPDTCDKKPVSVIIYSCYGMEMLRRVLPAFLNQNYPDYGVIVVDDEYDPDTKDFLTEMMLEHNNLYFTSIPQGTLNLSRKKLAITLGIKAAHNDYVLLTESNCQPQSADWLSLMMSKCSDGIDIVIGNTAHIDNSRSSLARYYYDFDQVSAKALYLSYALNGSTYRADACNLVIRKQLFFDIKGFSSTLNLHYGDDDLFVKQIANSGNTAVQIAHDAQLKSFGTSELRELCDYKMRHIFTARYLHTLSAYSRAAYSWLNWIMLLSLVTLIVLQPYNATFWIFVPVVLLSVWGVQIFSFDSAAKALDYKPLRIAVPLFTLLSPIINLRFRIKCRIHYKSNYTYQRKRRH